MDWKYNYEKDRWELIDDLEIVATVKAEEFDYYSYTIGEYKHCEFFNTVWHAKEYVKDLYLTNRNGGNNNE